MDNDFINNLGNMINNSNNTINPDMLKNIMNMLNNNTNSNTDFNVSENCNNSNNDTYENFPNIDINTLFKLKSILEKMNENKNDPRSNLLRSLKPYLKKSRQDKIEQYVQIFSVGKIINAFNQNGGEN